MFYLSNWIQTREISGPGFENESNQPPLKYTLNLLRLLKVILIILNITYASSVIIFRFSKCSPPKSFLLYNAFANKHR